MLEADWFWVEKEERKGSFYVFITVFIRNPCSVITNVIFKKSCPKNFSLTIQRYFVTQEKKNDCRTTEKDVIFFIPNFKSMFQENKDTIKHFQKETTSFLSLKLPCPENKSLLVRMKKS